MLKQFAPLVGPDALIGPFPGGTVCRLYKRGDGDLPPHPSGLRPATFPQGKAYGRVRAPAPTADTETVRSSRRGRCPHRAVPRRYSVPPLQKRRRRPAPSSVWPSASHLPPGEGLRAGEGTRPYGMCRSVLSFRRGRTLAGPPRNGTQLSRAAQCAAPTQIPERSQTNPRAHTVRPYGVIRTGTVGSSKPGAGVEPHLS